MAGLERRMAFVSVLTIIYILEFRGVFRILKLRVLSDNIIFPMRVLTLADSNKCPKIAGAKAPIAPVLNKPL